MSTAKIYIQSRISEAELSRCEFICEYDNFIYVEIIWQKGQPFCFFAFLFHGDGLYPCLLYDVMNLIP